MYSYRKIARFFYNTNFSESVIIIAETCTSNMGGLKFQVHLLIDWAA